MKPEIRWEDISQIQQEIDQLTSLAAHAWGTWVEKRTGDTRSRRYYETLIISVLIKLVPSIYYHYAVAVDKPPARDPLGFAGQSSQTFFENMHNNDVYHATIDGLLSTLPAYENPGCETGSPPGLSATVPTCIPSIPKCDILLYKAPILRRDALKLSLFDLKKTQTLNDLHYNIPDEYVDHGLRQSLYTHLTGFDFPDLPPNLSGSARAILDILAFLLPFEFVELVEDIIKWGKKCADFSTPSVLVTGFGLLDLSVIGFSFYAAECVARGTRLIGWQHGGNYGETVTPGRCERWERRLSDRYITWGWTDEGEDVVAAPHPRQHLRRKYKVSSRSNARALWVGTAESRHVHFIDHSPIGKRFLGYFEHQRKIAAALPETIRERMVLRQARHDFGWGLEKDLGNIVPSAARSTPKDGTIVHLGAELGLVLIDYPGSTPYLECLAAGIPFLAVFDPSIYAVRKCQRHVFDRLEITGVITTDYTRAAKMLEIALRDPVGWFAEPDRASAVKEAKHVLMKEGNSLYFKEWLKIFKEQKTGRMAA